MVVPDAWKKGRPLSMPKKEKKVEAEPNTGITAEEAHYDVGLADIRILAFIND